MQDPRFIRFAVISYPFLQGLTAVPLGLSLVFAALWANQLHHRAEVGEVAFVTVVTACMLLATWPISLYYRRTYGTTSPSAADRRFDGVLGVAGAALGLGGFWLDVRAHLPFSAYGLVMAIAFMVVYLRITSPVGGRYLLYYPLLGLVAAVVSLLPVFGVESWWTVIGFRAQILGVATAMGILMIVAGIWSHFFLVRIMNSAPSVEHG